MPHDDNNEVAQDAGVRPSLRRSTGPRLQNYQELVSVVPTMGLNLKPASPKALTVGHTIQRAWSWMFGWDGIGMRRLRCDAGGRLVEGPGGINGWEFFALDSGTASSGSDLVMTDQGVFDRIQGYCDDAIGRIVLRDEAGDIMNYAMPYAIGKGTGASSRQCLFDVTYTCHSISFEFLRGDAYEVFCTKYRAPGLH